MADHMLGTRKVGQIMAFLSGKGPAGQAWVFGLRMDAKNMEGGGNWWYICLQPKGKMEIPVRLFPGSALWQVITLEFS
jgi:hypothetical protein